MKLNEMVPGTKIDLKVIQNSYQDDLDDEAPNFLTSVFDILDDSTFEMQMPIQGGQVILLPVNTQYEAVFIMENGLYKANCTVINRYKKDNFYLLRATLTTELMKYQRRQFYRFPCNVQMIYSALSEENAKLGSMGEIRTSMKEGPSGMVVRGYGTILDISGGGLRFSSSFDLSQVKYLYLQFSIEVGGEKKTLEQVGRLLESKKLEGSNKHMNRVKILFKDTDYQELIVRYIFEGERRLRQEGTR